MATIVERVSQVVAQSQGIMLDTDALVSLCISASRFYAGYMDIQDLYAGEEVTQFTDLSSSEWALIKPLFLLYVERQQSIMLEASRGVGVDPFGRSSSEIQQDIKQVEDEAPKKAFSQSIISIGFSK